MKEAEEQKQREAIARAKEVKEQARKVAEEQQGQKKNLKTSNVAKYKLRSQVQSVGDGTMNGWWVVQVQADNGGSTGPGIITLSDVRPLEDEMAEERARLPSRVAPARGLLTSEGSHDCCTSALSSSEGLRRMFRFIVDEFSFIVTQT